MAPLALCLRQAGFTVSGEDDALAPLVRPWLEQAGIIITASGGIFPLSVFGAGPAAFLNALPFRYTIQFPTDALCSRVAGADLAAGLALAAAWALALYALGRGVWAIGIRRFVAVGS